jgi:Asp-tRNA(Asn)/Glu-tRNA(Gln) amidotransferase A subunit family amidase
LIKDIEDAAGLPTTYGSLLFTGAAVATENGLVPGRLLAAGAIVVGKTNTPEFAFEAYTSNLAFGPTRNPWDTSWSPGGSSGGSAAALAAGLVAAATATDGGGSVRMPAAMCGLVGLKPTNGIIGRHPIPSWIDLSTDGPLGHCVDDVALLLDVCKGPTQGDPTALPWWEAQDSWPQRVLVSPRTYDWGPLPDGVRASFERAVASLESDLDLDVEWVNPAVLYEADNPDLDWFTICCAEQAHQLGSDLLTSRAQDFDPVFLGYMRRGLDVTIEGYLSARRRRFEYVRKLDALLGDDGVLVTPTVPYEGFLPDGRMSQDLEPGIDASAINTLLQNITGHPAISLPAGHFPNGLPSGLQVTGPRFHDGMLLNLGRAWERSNPWPLVAPGYTPFTIEHL